MSQPVNLRNRKGLSYINILPCLIKLCGKKEAAFSLTYFVTFKGLKRRVIEGLKLSRSNQDVTAVSSL